MKIGILSDIHLEFYDNQYRANLINMINDCDADYIVLAGDYHPNKEYRDYFLDALEKPKTVIMGNHDYYNGEWFDDFIEDDLFVGGCLWTNFGEDPLTEHASYSMITDFRRIKNWYPERVKSIFYEHKRKIFESDKPFVVTHNAPSMQSVRDIYKGGILSKFFCNDLDDEILNSNKKLWIHGHDHYRFDYMIGDCRVIENSVGYPNELEEKFEIKVIEI